jgi:bifunctional non-homologous end joining protein LigD
VNLATITFHVWYSRVGSLGCPDYVLLDLDPWEGCTLGTLARVALRIRDRLTAIGLAPLVKTSGGSGLHVIVPVATRWDYELAKAFANLVARRVCTDAPQEVTLERSLAKRSRGSVYVDWVQVGRGKTVVPPFVVRARPGAPVSTPLTWGEVEALVSKRTTETARELGRFTIANVPERLARGGDPWRKGWKPGDLEAAIDRARTAWGQSARAASTTHAPSR